MNMNLKNRMLKVLALSLIIFLSLGVFSNSSSAIELDIKQMPSEEIYQYLKSRPAEYKVSISEYELYEQIDNTNIHDSQQKSYVDDFKLKVEELSRKSKEELYSLGYSANRVEAIKNYDGSQESLLAIGGELDLELSSYDFKHDVRNYSGVSVKTRFRAVMFWEWTEPPINNHTDAIAMAWKANSGSLICNEDYVDAGVGYMLSGLEDFTEEAIDGILVNDNAISFSFPLRRSVPPMSDNAEFGYMQIELFNRDLYTTAIQLSWAYGHSYLVFTPKLSIDANNMSLSFGPSWKIDTIQDKDTFYSR